VASEVQSAIAEIARVLRPNAPLLVAFHVGDETRHINEWWKRTVSLDTHFFRTEWFGVQLGQAGRLVEEVVVRPPYIGHEVETERAYILARRTYHPGSGSS
jgi:hypothetical protein